MTGKRFRIEVLDKNNWLIEDTKTGENANPIDGTTNVLKGLISTLNKFNDENEQLRHDATILIQSNQDYRRENEELSNELNTYKESNKLLKQTIDRLQNENEELKQYKDAVWNCDSSKTIRVNRNTGEVDLIDKEYSDES